MSVADAWREGMRRQLARLQTRREEGMPRRGWKVGINVPEVQAMFGLHRPVVGWIDGRNVFENGASIEVPKGTALHAEPEICFRIGSDVAPRTTAAAALGAIAACAPALEIVDYAKPRASLQDVLAHSVFHHATVLGSERSGVDAHLIASIHADFAFAVGETICAPHGALVPEDPGALVVLVADLLADAGERLRAGDLVLSGAFTPRALPLAAGRCARARLGPLGEVSCTARAAPSRS